MLTIIGIVLGLVLAGLIFLRMQHSGSRTPPAEIAPKAGSRTEAAGKRAAPPVPKVSDNFKGVALIPQKDACAAAMKMRSKTMPDGFVQQIPVPGCDREKCDCKVGEIRGRRGNPRRVKVDRRGDVRFKDDRRKGRDRRQGHDAWNRGNA